MVAVVVAVAVAVGVVVGVAVACAVVVVVAVAVVVVVGVVVAVGVAVGFVGRRWPVSWVLGVDPGGRETGAVLLAPWGAPVHWAVIGRDGDDWARYGADLRRELDAMHDETIAAGAGFGVAVEGVRAPSPHAGITNPAGIIDAARVLGWVEAWSAELWDTLAVVVPPGGHGSAPLAVYPAELVGERETAGGGRLRHARSAYDIARSIQ